MKLEEIYNLIIKKGMEKDPRTKKELKNELKRIRREYRTLKIEDKKYFDKEKFKHPYADTRILYMGDRKKHIRTIMAGIDISGEELLTAYLLNEKGAGIDLVMSHHPAGRALSNLHGVMHIHTDILHRLGIEMDIAKSIMKERIEEVSRGFSKLNHQRSVDIARLLDISFICAHTPVDNHVVDFLEKLFDRKKPARVRDVLRLLKTIPEYQDAMVKGAGPNLIAGKENNKTGRIFVDMTGGTEGSKKVFARLSQIGVGTIVAMHLSEEHLKKAKAEFINVIVAGHIASDALGLNLILDELIKRYDFNIIPCSGFARVKR
ncbi:MAG: NGG1p interacting factor NIF3 [Candidatus Omnitrophota bacterium]|nr:MAG: NGG1p interacting factor NIF3 [Candidatus Omnitrophota bacterium]